MTTSHQTEKTAWRQRARWLLAHAGPFIALLLILAAFVVGLSMGGSEVSAPAAADKASDTRWTCMMHQHVDQPAPGKCPICAMDLIPRSQRPTALHPRQLTVSPAAEALMNVQVTPVQRRYVDAKVRLVGKVTYDETRLSTITAWMGGRLDRLYVDYTGTVVREGDHLVEIYSPELLVAQDELIKAKDSLQRLRETASASARRNAQALLDAAREKLRLLGLKPEQIQRIENSEQPADRLTIYAPNDGIVIEKHAKEGMYVQIGSKIYTTADLDHVWIMLDAYESDLQWLRFAQQVEFTAEAYPGRTFTGQIAFISPVLSEGQRTVNVRVNVDNKDGLLKPGMFVRAIVHSQVAAGGKVVDPSLAGKWISPMHPEIVKDHPGTCDICGMKLVRVEELGYSVAAPTQDKPLVVPASAVLRTGQRAIAYVKIPTDQADPQRGPTYEGRQITLGPKAGQHYIVKDGLREGELVVTRGNFKIDAALQIQARPSMMNPEEDQHADHAHEHAAHVDVDDAFVAGLKNVLAHYLQVAHALSQDAPESAAKQAEQLKQAAGQLASDKKAVQDDVSKLQDTATKLAAAEGAEALRKQFEPVSRQLDMMVQRYGDPRLGPVYRVHCPMAMDNEGADWLSAEDRVLNPYFGARMLKCGEVKKQLIKPGDSKPSGEQEKEHQHAH